MTITNYTIKQTIGHGGMAAVYLAHDIKFQTNVAIKVLNKEYVHNDNIRKRFIAEARNMYKMSHPNIIKVTDLIDEGDTVAFVMEYIEGETLKEYLDRRGKLSDDEINNFFTQMLDALGYVHKQNLVHRDIKPSNFMVDVEGKIKLLDFGIAKTTDVTSSEYTQTGTGIQMGTPLYMSPEQVKSSKEVGASSDIYSLGVVLWQMVMGKKPYDSNTLSSPEIQVSILKELLPITNTNWDAIIQKATAKDVLNRYETCLEIKKALSKISEVEEKTILSNAAEKTIVEPKVVVEKEAELGNNKTVDLVKENSENTIIDAKKLIKYSRLFLVIIPILLFSIYKYPFKSEENPPEEITLPTEVPQEVEFPSVKIGNQEWMIENLYVDTFRNGDTIPEAKTKEEWEEAGILGKPAFCYLNYIDKNGFYGKLYNWYAVNDPRGLAPKGWHIPTNAEWTKLTDYLGGEDIAGGKMKDTIMSWNSPNAGATNESGFSGLPVGMVAKNDGKFYYSNEKSMWWSSSEYDNYRVCILELSYDSGYAIRSLSNKENGCSVRCVKDYSQGSF
jgi:uncharacterized protein (TIGR02145 family)